jgi:hypothetical protein
VFVPFATAFGVVNLMNRPASAISGKTAHSAAIAIGKRNESRDRANRIAITNSSPVVAGILQMVAG